MRKLPQLLFASALLTLGTPLPAQQPQPPTTPQAPGLVIPPLLQGAGQLQVPGDEPAVPEDRPMKPRGQVSQLLDSGSFEQPRVKGRTPSAKGGNPVPKSQGEWLRITYNTPAQKEPDSLVVGLTNELARTGAQSLFVAFNKAKAQLARADLVSQLIPIKPDFTYRVAIWGRMDRKNPITIDQRIPSCRLQVDFLQADGLTQAGESSYRVQPMPGTLNRPLVFVTDQWTEFYADVESPSDAAFIRVVWSWSTPAEVGETSGVIYFDDAVIYGERVTPDLELTDTDAPDTTTTTSDTVVEPDVSATMKRLEALMTDEEKAAAREAAPAPGQAPAPAAPANPPARR